MTRPATITPLLVDVLRAIHRYGPATKCTLASRTGKSAEAMARALSQLQSRGLITTSAFSREAWRYSLTAQGRGLAAEVWR